MITVKILLAAILHKIGDKISGLFDSEPKHEKTEAEIMSEKAESGVDYTKENVRRTSDGVTDTTTSTFEYVSVIPGQITKDEKIIQRKIGKLSLNKMLFWIFSNFSLRLAAAITPEHPPAVWKLPKKLVFML